MSSQNNEGNTVGSMRPVYHFAPDSGWMNDPNGLIFYQGEYHLFYQHHPHSLVWGPMHWGHAVSADLLHWTHLPIALYPDQNGTIFSGSVVADTANTSGLLPEGGLVAVFSFDTQAQGIAYSIDRGRTWTKYAGNPVIPSPGHDFRDPKVFWHAPEGVWIMAIAAQDHIEFFRSPNLIDWTLTGAFGAEHGAHGGVWECPDLFPLVVGSETKWVLIVSVGVGGGAPAGGSGMQYFVGRFDGQTFTSDNPPETTLWLDYGPDNYAAVTYGDVPDGRRILIGWMNDGRYAQTTPAGAWRGMLSCPRELSLVDLPGHGVRLVQAPVRELVALRSRPASERDLVLHNSAAALPPFDRRAMEIRIQFSRIDALEVGLRLLQPDGHFIAFGVHQETGTLFVDRRASGEVDFHPAFPAEIRAPLIDIHRPALRILLDGASAEVFADGGATVVSAQVFPTFGEAQLEVYARTGSVTVSRLDVWQL